MSSNLKYILLGTWAIMVVALCFWVTRADFPFLIGCYALAFVSYIFLTQSTLDEGFIKKSLYLGLIIRVIAVFAFPHFSDDIYRFWWDGKCIVNGINPFDFIPQQLLEHRAFQDDFSHFIFKQLNSPTYYSVYPSCCQWVFNVSYRFSPNDIYGFSIALKSILCLCEFGTIFFLLRLNAPKKTLIYALNPLIIVELCANAHFEAMMVFFFIAMLYLLLRNFEIKKIPVSRIVASSILLALSIASKLLTLLFFPFIFKKIGIKQGVVFGIILGCTLLLCFFPYYNSTFISHFVESVQLYFQKFEFNASLYYIIKSMSLWYFGYTATTHIATFFTTLTIIVLVYLFFQKKNFYEQLFLMMFFYLCFQRAVHPWYLSLLIVFSTFVPYRFGIWWSGLIFLSYSHYWDNAYKENFLFLVLEYGILFVLMCKEILKSDYVNSRR